MMKPCRECPFRIGGGAVQPEDFLNLVACGKNRLQDITCHMSGRTGYNGPGSASRGGTRCRGAVLFFDNLKGRRVNAPENKLVFKNETEALESLQRSIRRSV